ncbi:hypothetical protein LCGC14_1980920 [marine sediment metagenome]|uniref:Uncharacterized protein n=1 Tax=marine sediment metagenome TaxID=412755 RepID=A0A0F9FX75_9ZZZZ
MTTVKRGTLLDGAFHYKDGWYFARRDEGKVWIFHVSGEANKVMDGLNVQTIDIDQEIEVDASSWASIVSSVCLSGDTAETYRQAVDFHMQGQNMVAGTPVSSL